MCVCIGGQGGGREGEGEGEREGGGGGGGGEREREDIMYISTCKIRKGNTLTNDLINTAHCHLISCA